MLTTNNLVTSRLIKVYAIYDKVHRNEYNVESNIKLFKPFFLPFFQVINIT